MNKIVEVLMRRDGMTFEEAAAAVEDAKKLLDESDFSFEAAEEILADEFGLEPDYIFDLL